MEAYILAGGKSTRMGEDKGLKQLNGKPMIQYVLDVVTPLFNTIKISTSNKEYSKLGYELISDIIADKGPMGGLYTALKNSGTENVFIISCDAPCVSAQSVQYLLQQLNKEYVAIIASYSGRIQPLLGIYNKKTIPVIKRNIDSNQLKMMSFLEEIQVKKIELSNIEQSDIFLNANTPEEFNLIEKRLKHEN